jgi:hypothetical protein
VSEQRKRDESARCPNSARGMRVQVSECLQHLVKHSGDAGLGYETVTADIANNTARQLYG